MKWQFINIHAATSRLSHANVYISMRPRVRLKFTCLWLSSLHYYICPCISNQAPLTSKTCSEFNTNTSLQQMFHRINTRAATDLFLEISFPPKWQFEGLSNFILKGISCESETPLWKISLQCSFKPIHIKMSKRKEWNTLSSDILLLTLRGGVRLCHVWWLHEADDICYCCQETDSGVYTCLASSSSGETSWSGVLTVKGKVSLHAWIH